jgi:hypothetical protein
MSKILDPATLTPLSLYKLQSETWAQGADFERERIIKILAQYNLTGIIGLVKKGGKMKNAQFKDLDNLMRAVLAIFPDAILETDGDGEIIVMTGYKEYGKNGRVRIYNP